MSKKAEKYNTFGKRLLTVADARQMGDTGTLANAIYSNKRCREIVKIREHNEDGKHKSLQIKKRNMEDSFLGAHHRMLSCIEHFLLDYAEEWAEKQHTDYEEKYYKEALKIRKALKAKEDKK